jgi:hypothetical protein
MDTLPRIALKINQINWRNEIKINGSNPKEKRQPKKQQFNTKVKAKLEAHPQPPIQSPTHPTKGNLVKINALS